MARQGLGLAPVAGILPFWIINKLQQFEIHQPRTPHRERGIASIATGNRTYTVMRRPDVTIQSCLILSG